MKKKSNIISKIKRTNLKTIQPNINICSSSVYSWPGYSRDKPQTRGKLTPRTCPLWLAEATVFASSLKVQNHPANCITPHWSNFVDHLERWVSPWNWSSQTFHGALWRKSREDPSIPWIVDARTVRSTSKLDSLGWSWRQVRDNGTRTLNLFDLGIHRFRSVNRTASSWSMMRTKWKSC